jgi:hypothetical protein
MYAMQPISAREVVDFRSDNEHMDLGSESNISDAERSQMHLPPNMRTNDTIFI